MVHLLLMLQATVGDGSFDLRHTIPSERGDAIVVKGRRPADQRLPPLPDTAMEEGSAIPRAEIGLLGRSRLGVTAEQSSVGGWVSNRAMLSVKLPF